MCGEPMASSSSRLFSIASSPRKGVSSSRLPSAPSFVERLSFRIGSMILRSTPASARTEHRGDLDAPFLCL